MNKLLKSEIKKAFVAAVPDEEKKAALLKALPQPKISTWQFIITQALYLRKQTWILSVLFLLPALICTYQIDHMTIWVISSFAPFLGLLAVAENNRSMVYGMSEFELSARFSLKSVMLARMSILGVLDALILCCLIPLCCVGNDFSLIQVGFYLLVPYLLSVNISLWVTRHFCRKDVIYGCMGASSMVSALNIACRLTADYIYQFTYIGWWVIVFIGLIMVAVHEIYYTIKQTEELTWSL